MLSGLVDNHGLGEKYWQPAVEFTISGLVTIRFSSGLDAVMDYRREWLESIVVITEL